MTMPATTTPLLQAAGLDMHFPITGGLLRREVGRVQAVTGVDLELHAGEVLGVVAEVADEVVVMYAGRVVERAPVTELFERPAHPYTIGLLNARPRAGRTRHDGTPLSVIPGSLPAPRERGQGCRFRARCAQVHARCHEAEPPLQAVRDGHEAACFLLSPPA